MNEQQKAIYDAKRDKLVEYAQEKLAEECFVNYVRVEEADTFEEWRDRCLVRGLVPTWLSIDELYDRTQFYLRTRYEKKLNGED